MPNTYREDVILLSALASEVRMRVLALIRYDEMAVGDIADKLAISQSALSQHLGKLRSAGLVSSRRDAQSRLYRMISPIGERLLAILDASSCRKPTARPPWTV